MIIHWFTLKRQTAVRKNACYVYHYKLEELEERKYRNLLYYMFIEKVRGEYARM